MQNPETNKLMHTMEAGRAQKTPLLNRNLQWEYAMRPINNSMKDAVPEGAGYNETEWNPGPGIQWQEQGGSVGAENLFLNPVNNINAHRANLNRHYIDPTAAARRLYRSTPGRLTKKLYIDVETNQLRPDGISMPPLHVLEHDPRQIPNERSKECRYFRASLTFTKRWTSTKRSRTLNGAEAYRPYQRVDIYPNPVPLLETGEKIPYGRWNNPESGDGYYGMKETLDEAQRVIQDDRLVRGYNLEKELAFYKQNNQRIRGFNIPDPFNIRQKAQTIARNNPTDII